MPRVLSSRRQHGGYEKLTPDDEAKVEPQLRKSATPPPTSKAAAKIHPFLAMLGGRKKDCATPRLGRYLEYLKEGGVWDAKSNTPRIYYK